MRLAAGIGEPRGARQIVVGRIGPGQPDPGAILADVSAFYRAFAFRPVSEDPPDHVAVEAGFLGYLAVKEAYARGCGDVEQAELTCRAADGFGEAHLRFLADPLASRLESSAPAHLVLAARRLADLVGSPPALSGPWIGAPAEAGGPFCGAAPGTLPPCAGLGATGLVE